MIGVGTFVAGRYRVDLVLSEGASPSLLATRFPDGEKVLLKPIRHSITARHGALLVHLVKEAKVAGTAGANLLPILDFVIDENTQECVLVIGYDRSRTAAQIVDPNGAEEATARAFLEIASGLLERYQHDRVHATPEAARGSGDALVPAPAPPEAEEEWVHARANYRSTADRVVDPEKKRKNDLYALMMLIAVVGVMGLLVFSGERTIELEPDMPDWYHDYGGGGGGGDWADYGDGDPNDRFANDPDFRAAQAHWIVVRTKPSGGNVYLGASFVGRAPVSVVRPKQGEELELRVSRPGYTDAEQTLNFSSPREIVVTLGGQSVKEEISSFIEELKAGNKTDIGPEDTTPDLDIKGRRVPDGAEKRRKNLYDDD